MRSLAIGLLCALSLPLAAQRATPPRPVERAAPETALSRKIAAMIAEPKVARDHWGVAVYGLDGRAIVSLNEGQLFQPASNAKLFTAAAALAILGDQATYNTTVVGRGEWSGPVLKGDLTIVGGGDANLSGRDFPYTGGREETGTAPPLRYLERMADAVVASGLKTVSGDIVGDDTLFPWEPYPAEWAVDDLVWGYGAPVSALAVDDNQLRVVVTPGNAGEPASVTVDPPVPYYTIVDTVRTGPAKRGSSVQFDRALGSKVLRIYGTIAADAGADTEEVAIQDPAEYAAIAFKRMLETRGIAVQGVARAEHRVSLDAKGFQSEAHEPWNIAAAHNAEASTAAGGARDKLLATHTSVPLGEDLVMTDKLSQNLHAEIMLHHLGERAGQDGSTVQGVRVVRAFLLKAGLQPDEFTFFDGSGMSGHDLVTPRAAAKILLYAHAQPWGELYRSSLPVAGVDGTLSTRFLKSPVRGKVWAKTGTTGESRALSGYIDCASGQTVVFSIMVGNRLPGTSSDRDVIDRIVEAIAAAN